MKSPPRSAKAAWVRCIEPSPGAKVQVSTNRGVQARWRRDGNELFYVALDERLMAVPIRFPSIGQTAEAGSPVSLFYHALRRGEPGWG